MKNEKKKFKISQPKKSSIKDRFTTLNAEFIKSKVPYKKATDDELISRYKLFYPNGDISSPKCFYCESNQTEWDHLFSSLKEKKELAVGESQTSGYFHEINNLIPSCNHCNQSKGNQQYDKWLRSKSKKAKHNLYNKLKQKNISDKKIQTYVSKKIRYIKKTIDDAPPTTLDFQIIHSKHKNLKSLEKKLTKVMVDMQELLEKSTLLAEALAKGYEKTL